MEMDFPLKSADGNIKRATWKRRDQTHKRVMIHQAASGRFGDGRNALEISHEVSEFYRMFEFYTTSFMADSSILRRWKGFVPLSHTFEPALWKRWLIFGI